VPAAVAAHERPGRVARPRGGERLPVLAVGAKPGGVLRGWRPDLLAAVRAGRGRQRRDDATAPVGGGVVSEPDYDGWRAHVLYEDPLQTWDGALRLMLGRRVGRGAREVVL